MPDTTTVELSDSLVSNDQLALDRANTLPRKHAYTPQFVPPGYDPYATVEWILFQPAIKAAGGKVVFAQENVEAPSSWSERAVRIVTQKYFRGHIGTPGRETSIKQIIDRVCNKIRQWGHEQGYFAGDADSLDYFIADLKYLLVNQMFAFNSPVWFNLGVEGEPQQASACFIQSVQDDMQSIAQLQMDETMVFKRGSGSGSNFSHIRSRRETLLGGGKPSGPVSFMEGLDAWGGVIKSGGKTRRAAKMCVLDIDHPDIDDFINSKIKEEKKAHALIDAGFSGHFDDADGAYASIKFQNANHSVRVTDLFMEQLVAAQKTNDRKALWNLYGRNTKGVLRSIPILDLWDQLCEAAHFCGDPGIQFHTVTNRWHTCPADGEIRASNPCSEYLFLDDTSCNLGSLNLMKFRSETADINWQAFEAAVATVIIAQDILVSKAFYPTERLTKTTKEYRTLGLGYANLGAYLMSQGLAYDSEKARQITREITSRMTAKAYCVSADLSAAMEPFPAFDHNRTHMLEVIDLHRAAAEKDGLSSAARNLWRDAYLLGAEHGYRNAQVTVIAPTGTIAFMMDCDTTGCEPEASLVKTKHLVGGGIEVLENRIVDCALRALNYDAGQRKQLMAHLVANHTLEGALPEEHLPVFDCAIPSKGNRVLSLDAHLLMTAAIQPYVSGGISKTMNVPHETTAKALGDAYVSAWKLGIKSVSVYRDGCKRSQPLQTKEQAAAAHVLTWGERKKLQQHQTNMHRIKFEFGATKGYMMVTPYEDTGMPGEVFVKLAKEGSTISGLVDGWAQMMSYCLQTGVTLETLVEKFKQTQFEPNGFSSDPDIRFATSMYDGIMRKLKAVFLDKKEHMDAPAALSDVEISALKRKSHEGPPCVQCGNLTVANGTCHVCTQCGTTTGCG